MTDGRPTGPDVRRVLVATDLSATATHAVRWAAELAARYHAELVLVQVVVDPGNGATVEADADADGRLAALATEMAGARGRARVVAGSDPADAIVAVAEAEEADVLVVGNVGMSDRREFLL